MDREGLEHADQETAEDRAPDVAHAAQHHRRDALERDLLAHERARLLVVEREEKSAERGEEPADDEDHRHDAAHRNAEQDRGLGILGDGAQSAAGPGLLQEQVQERDRDDRAGEADQLWQRDHRRADAQADAREGQRHALQVRAPGDQHQVLEQDQEGHRGDERHEVLGAAHQAISEALDEEREDTAGCDGEERRDEPRHAGLQRKPRDHAGDHEKTRNAEVEEVQHADRERERHRDERVHAAEHQPVDELLLKHVFESVALPARSHRAAAAESARRCGTTAR